MFLENKYLKFNGLNLTVETLDGLLKHNGPFKHFSKLDSIIGTKNFKNKINFHHNTSLEAQIASISDDVAYNNHDVEVSEGEIEESLRGEKGFGSSGK